MTRWMLIALLAGTVTTCGQKGPLYLPDQQAAVPLADMPTHVVRRD